MKAARYYLQQVRKETLFGGETKRKTHVSGLLFWAANGNLGIIFGHSWAT